MEFTQGVIAVSSSEAECHGLVKGVSVALGWAAVRGSFGVEAIVALEMNANAAVAADTRGLGKVRRVEVRQPFARESKAWRYHSREWPVVPVACACCAGTAWDAFSFMLRYCGKEAES